MDIWQILSIGLRRWKVTVPFAVVGLWLAWTLSGSIAPAYTAQASLLYLPPSASVIGLSPSATVLDPTSPDFDPNIGEVVETRNPFAGSLRSAVLAAEIYMGSQQLERAIDDLGLSTKYSVKADNRNAVLYIGATSSSAKTAIQTMERLVDVAKSDLSQRQDEFNVDPRERVTSQVLAKDEAAVVDLGQRLRIRAILLIMALGLAFGLGVMIEGIVDYRARDSAINQDRSGKQDHHNTTLTIQIPDDVAREVGLIRHTTETNLSDDIVEQRGLNRTSDENKRMHE